MGTILPYSCGVRATAGDEVLGLPQSPDGLHAAGQLLRERSAQGFELGEKIADSAARHQQRDTSSAMGLPRRVITTAWPASTASKRLESRVLACATVTCTMAVNYLGFQP